MNDQRIPQVSIMLCTYNRADLLSFAIQSVLDQTFQDWELLILDDASTDHTESVVKEYLRDNRIRYTQHPTNLGITKNRNFGLKESRGEYIAVLDSDDMWLDDNKLQKQIDFFDNHKDYVLAGTDMLVIDQRGQEISKTDGLIKLSRIMYTLRHSSNIEKELNDSALRNSLLITNQIIQSSIVFRKETALQAGGYDESLLIWEDWDLWLKLGLKGKMINLPFVGVAHREHSGKISYQNKKAGVYTALEIIKRYRKSYSNYWLGWLKLQIKRCLLIFNF